MSEEQPKTRNVTLEEIVERWNGVAPHLDALAHNMRLNLDPAADLARSRQTIGAFLGDCQDVQAMKTRQAARSPEEQAVLEEAERVLLEKSKQAGVKLKKVLGDDAADAAEDCPADSPETAADCENQPETPASEDGNADAAATG